MATPKQGSAFENPMYIDGLMKGKDKNGDTVWMAMKTAGKWGGVKSDLTVCGVLGPKHSHEWPFFLI